LNAYDGDTGAAISYPGQMVEVPGSSRYTSPIAAKGRIYVASIGTIIVFALGGS
jgi:hypothetical protein